MSAAILRMNAEKGRVMIFGLVLRIPLMKKELIEDVGEKPESKARL